ncbi:MFS monocarboxylate transporter, putative [Talaromyces stipitatus ATCC 10500]|uniref:4a-hydroxytetrahydrobiopterin dehydratase n=1 Tax=Talaromyces stipitatus (strain ATCC 10500 / CBS 375.48 / QM 6759 / NRRL 1006) TaxID=441959 RepID=B8MNJ1_TALSN|nr:MFS monocarboxylate transporter, putative [Talaromyces stipitatus ATCC 10500]EED14080.1 MFS monocarboxylate transporter, putative [Talaromyces stipitatus ATCC 10500]
MTTYLQRPRRRELGSSISTPKTPIFAESENPEQLSAPLQSLLDEKQWTLGEGRMMIAKTYYFKTYTKCLDFVLVVGIRSKSKNHHPTITLKSGSVSIHWTTHFPRGLTRKDVDMAQYCDQQAASIGTVQPSEANKSCLRSDRPLEGLINIYFNSRYRNSIMDEREVDIEKAAVQADSEQDGHKMFPPAPSICASSEHDREHHPISRSPSRAEDTAPSVISKALTLVRTRESTQCPSPPPDGGILAWSQMVLAHLVIMNTWGYVSAFGVFQSYYTKQLNESPSTISWIGSTQTFLVFFIGTFSGRATDAGYFKFIWTCGMLIAIASLFLTSLCTEYWQIFLSQGLMFGIGCGLMFCPTVALLPTYFDKHRALAMSTTAAGSATGGLIIPAMVNSLLPKIGFAWTLRCLGFFTLATLLPSLVFLRQRLPPRATGPIVEWKAFLEVPYTCFALGMFFILLGLYVGFFYISSYARDALGASMSTSTDLLMVMSAVGFPARIIPGLVSDTFTGPLNSLIPFAFCSAITAYGWAGVSNMPGLYVWAVIYGIMSAAVQGLFPVALSSLTDDLKKTGVRMGMVLTIVSFGALTGSPIAGALVQADNNTGDSKGEKYLYMQMFMGSVILLGGGLVIVARVRRFGVGVVKG